MTAPAELYDQDELQGRAFALQRAAEDALAACRALMLALERGSVPGAVESATEAVDRLQARLWDVRAVEGRTAMIDQAIERFVVGGGLGDGPSDAGHDLFADLLVMGASARETRVTVADAARRLFWSRRALSRRLLASGYPTTSIVLSWGALLKGMYLWHVEGRDFLEAARLSGFPDQGCLSQALCLRTGMYPRAWRDAGADFDALCDAMVATWRAS